MVELNNEQSGQLPLGSRYIFETDDLLAARDHLARFLGQHTINPLEKNYQVRFRHCATDIGRVSINALQYGAAIRIGVRPAANTFLLLVLLKGTGTVKQEGHITPISEHAVYMFNPGVPATLELSSEQINFTIKIPMSAFNDFLERESGRTLLSELEFLTYFEEAQISGNALRRFIKFLCGELDEGNLNINVPLIEKLYEQTILGLVLTDLPHNYNEFIGMEPLEPAPEYIRRVEKYISENFTETVSLSDLAECAAISVRALQNGFRRFRNTTPMEYLRDYRLNMSRQKLGDEQYADLNISEIATRSGFSHLSKFAKCYRQRFGETPSETRKKA
jgi:AraC-like DNA-binding protein